MTRTEILSAVAGALEAKGFRVEAHLDMTEYLVIRGAKNGGIYIAGTNLKTWAADFYANEAALDRGIGEIGGGFVTGIASSNQNPRSIADALLSRLSQNGGR